MDDRCPLDDVLDLLRVRGALMANMRAHAPWGLRVPATSGATFHGITAGTCWLRVPGQPPRELHAGDVVLLPTGVDHVIASEPTGPARAWDRDAKARERSAAGEIVLEGLGRSTHIICAAYDYDRDDVAHPFVSLLPNQLVVSDSATADGIGVQSIVRMLEHELAAVSAGRRTVVDRLIDVLFVQVIRVWLMDQDAATSWLRALRDPVVARALTAMHSRPASPWTLESLAREVSLSRATLTRRFTALVGEAPLTYLTRWRMDLAARDLRYTDDGVSAIAQRVGYTSEFAFSRAFTRVRGTPPSRYRVAARAS